jgi:YVTN family beta-propeller protein
MLSAASVAFAQAPTPAGPFAYISNANSRSVSVINTSANTVVATISLCGDCASEPQGLAVTPGGKFVYVADRGTGSVEVIATATNSVTTTINLPTFCTTCFAAPVGVAVTPDGSHVYVTDVGQNLIDVIDTSTNLVVFPTSSEEGDVVNLNGPIAITPDGTAAFYTFGTGSVGRFATSTNTHTTTLAVGSNPQGIAITPNGAFIYVANEGDGTVSVIPNPGFSPITSVSLGGVDINPGPFSLAITPDGKSVYVVNSFNTTVSVISTATNTVATTITTGFCGALNQIAITADGTKAYVADVNADPCNKADVITIATNTVSPSIGVGFSPYGAAASGSQTQLMGPPGTTTTFTFDTDTYKITGITNHGGEQVTVDAFLVPASKFPSLNGFSSETCLPYGDYSSGGVDTCVEFQVHCQISTTDATPCNFLYIVATGYDLPADLSGGIGGPDFLVAHGVDCLLTSSSMVQSIFLSYDATVKDPTTKGGSLGPSCFVATYTPGAPPVTSSTTRFVGFQTPVSNTSLNMVKAGSTRPLTFQFFDNLGNPVTNLSLCNSFTATATGNVCTDSPTVPTPWVNFSSFGIACPNNPNINLSTDGAIDSPGNSAFQNLGGGSYQINWKTLKGWKGFCANVVVTFNSGLAGNSFSGLVVVPAAAGFQFN